MEPDQKNEDTCIDNLINSQSLLRDYRDQSLLAIDYFAEFEHQAIDIETLLLNPTATFLPETTLQHQNSKLQNKLPAQDPLNLHTAISEGEIEVVEKNSTDLTNVQEWR